MAFCPAIRHCKIICNRNCAYKFLTGADTAAADNFFGTFPSAVLVVPFMRTNVFPAADANALVVLPIHFPVISIHTVKYRCITAGRAISLMLVRSLLFDIFCSCVVTRPDGNFSAQLLFAQYTRNRLIPIVKGIPVTVRMTQQIAKSKFIRNYNRILQSGIGSGGKANFLCVIDTQSNTICVWTYSHIFTRDKQFRFRSCHIYRRKILFSAGKFPTLQYHFPS